MPTPGFTNSAVIVTGAASGIGRQLALQAAVRGAAVLATDIQAAGLEETRETGRRQGLEMETALLDVGDPEAIRQFARRVLPWLGGRKLILINNAGVGLFTGDFGHTELDDFAWLLDINLWGVVRLTKAFYPYFLKRNEGHIVNLSSVFGLGGFTNQSAYCTSKFAVRGFTETLRMELAGTGICTTCVHPGGVKTNIVRHSLPRGAVATEAMHRESIASFEQSARTTPEKAARLILNAVEKKKERLLIGSDAKALDLITRLFPVWYSRILKKQVERTFSNPFTRKGNGQ
jgi:butyryl-CoA dehydrogenase